MLKEQLSTARQSLMFGNGTLLLFVTSLQKLSVSCSNDRKLSSKSFTLLPSNTIRFNVWSKGFLSGISVLALKIVAISGIRVQEPLLETLNLIVSCR